MTSSLSPSITETSPEAPPKSVIYPADLQALQKFVNDPTLETASRAFAAFHTSNASALLPPSSRQMEKAIKEYVERQGQDYQETIRAQLIEKFNNFTKTPEALSLFPVEKQKEDFWLSLLHSTEHATAYSSLLESNLTAFTRNTPKAPGLFKFINSTSFRATDYNADQQYILSKFFDMESLQPELIEYFGPPAENLDQLGHLWLNHYRPTVPKDTVEERSLLTKINHMHSENNLRVLTCGKSKEERKQTYERVITATAEFYEENIKNSIINHFFKGVVLQVSLWSLSGSVDEKLDFEEKMDFLKKMKETYPNFISQQASSLMPLIFGLENKKTYSEFDIKSRSIYEAMVGSMVFEKSCEIIQKNAILNEKNLLEQELGTAQPKSATHRSHFKL